MSKPEPDSGDIFQFANFRKLVELMREHDLNEVDLKRGPSRITLRRGAPAPSYVAAPPPSLFAQAAPAAAPAGGAPAAPAAPAAAEGNFVFIKAPVLGTFYLKPNPESPNFVKVGDHIGPETTVCLIEAMKNFSPIPAEVSGKIVAILVENGHPVEFNQPLFKVDPKG